MYDIDDNKKKNIFYATDTARKVQSNLSDFEALKIAQDYHEKYKIAGTIEPNSGDTIYLKENYYRFSGLAWFIKSKLEPNPFEGMDCLFIVVSDSKGCVEHVLDHTGGVMDIN